MNDEDCRLKITRAEWATAEGTLSPYGFVGANTIGNRQSPISLVAPVPNLHVADAEASDH